MYWKGFPTSLEIYQKNIYIIFWKKSMASRKKSDELTIDECIAAAKKFIPDVENLGIREILDLKKLEKLGKLRKDEVITEKEFQTKKKEILKRI